MFKRFFCISCIIVVFLLLMIFQRHKFITDIEVSSYFYPETVIIDPGHGGEDGGAIGEKIYFEKDINLDVSQKLEMIFNLHGVNTDMTRREDISLGENTSTSLRKRKVADLEKRVEKILSNSNATVISIHQNSFPQDARCSGAQVFYSENNIKSEFLAKRVQSCLKHGIDNSNTRQEKIADKSIFLLKKVMCPAILVECGFLSNPNELVLLNDESYRMNLAMCIASGFFEYKKEM